MLTIGEPAPASGALAGSRHTETRETAVDEVRNLIIIGSGPAGYTAAVYAARANLKPLVIEGVQSGGALMTTTEVENFPGFPDGIMGPELMDNMRKQAERFGAEFLTDDVDPGRAGHGDDRRRVWVGETAYRAKAVILATGSAWRPLGVPGRAGAARPRRLVLRHLRRLLLPQPAHRGRRRRRLGDGGGHASSPASPRR